MATAFLEWYSAKILLISATQLTREVSGLGAVFWYIFVILGTAPVLLPFVLLAGVVEIIQGKP